jgi:SAM-dependent methyltransferase
VTDPKHRTNLWIEIALVSFAVLFQELALIRWIPAQVRVTAYFPNVVLMSAFLGLGLGCVRARSRVPFWLWPVSMLMLIVTSVAMSRVAFTQESESVHLWLLYFDLKNAPVINDIRLPIVTLFALSALTFVPLGHFLARRIRDATARGLTLRGYAFDLLGSLAGIAAFSALSFFESSPVVWFLVIALMLFPLLGSGSIGRAATFISVSIVVAALAWVATGNATFSPYYSISTAHQEGFSGPVLLANGSLHQYPAPVTSPVNYPGLTARDESIRSGYPIPYALMRRPPGRVLVLGAGTGNDVAVALERGATAVDAVEIDPVITSLGRKLHPNHPYLDPRVTVIHDDARSFLERTSRRYDLVVFGTLDSMTRVSALSSVRLDNFVYTREALEAAKRVMKPDGGLVMYFMVGTEYIGSRLVALHEDVFGRMPATAHDHHVMFNLVVMSGPAFAHVPRRLTSSLSGAEVERPTDDWPFLYLSSRAVPRVYVDMILALAFLALLATLASSRSMRSDAARGRVDVEMLALGAGFLLLETRAVTQMNLVWEATWISSAVVFSSILATLLLATLFVERRPVSSGVSIAGLIVTLIASYFVPVSSILGASVPVRLGLTFILVGAPVFFASTLFAVRFAARRDTDAALGWNLLGAVLGGLIEFSSIVLGIRMLALIALALYLLAATARRAGSTDHPDEAAAAFASPAGR